VNLSRRNFLGAGAACAAPFVFSGCGALRCAANERIRIGVVGLGRIASTFEIPNIIRLSDKARIVAVCDLDKRRVDAGVKRVVDGYAQKGILGAVVDAYSDYKALCARPDIDAVMVCVPDFWHALIAKAVISSGKHLWLQKPFTQTIGEGRYIADLAKKHGVVVQVGSQQRSEWRQFHDVCELVRNGRIGAVKRVEVGIGLDVAGGSSKEEKVPETFDYLTWLGPTKYAPYNWTRCHTQDLEHIWWRPGWIQLAPYGWGMITNWGAHHMDIVQWGLGHEFDGPTKVEGTCKWMDLSGGKLWNVHTNYDLHYTYGETDVHVCDKYQNGVKFIGEKGDWLFCCRGAAKVTPSDPDQPAKPGQLAPFAASRNALLEPIANPETPLMLSTDHFANWLDAVAARDPRLTVTSAEVGHRSTSACSLGQMCMELGRGKSSFALDWNPAKESTGNAAADAMMKPFSNGNAKYDLFTA